MINFLWLVPISSKFSPDSVQSLECVLSNISTQVGLPIDLSPSIRNCFLYVNPQKMSPDELLTAVCKSISASARRHNGRIVVERSLQDRQEIQDRVSNWQRKLIELNFSRNDEYRSKAVIGSSLKSAIMASINDLARKNDPTLYQNARVGDQAVNYLLPSSKLSQNLARYIGAKTLSGIATNSAVAFSSPKSVYSRSLEGAPALYASFIQECTSLPLGSIQSLWNDKFMNGPFGPREFGSIDAFRKVEKIRLEVRPNIGNISVLLEGYDKSGARKLSDFTAITEEERPLQPNDSARAAASSPGNVLVDLPAESLAATQALGGFSDLKGFSNGPPSWLMKPTENEPLNAMVLPVIRAMSVEDPEIGFLINLCDSAATVVNRVAKNGKVSTETFSSILKRDFGYEEVKGNKCIIWKPRDPIAQEALQADRKVLQKFAQTVSGKRTIEFGNLLTLYSSGSSGNSRFTLSWASMCERVYCDRPLLSSIQPSIFRLLGKIRSQDWKRLVDGEALRLSELGIVKDAYEFLNVEQNLELLSSSPISDLHRHPLELFQKDEIGSVVIQVRRESQPFEAIWNEGQDEPDAIRPKGSSDTQPPSVPYLYANQRLRRMMDRNSFDTLMSKQLRRYGEREVIIVTMSLPQDCSLRFEWFGRFKPTTGVLRYSELAEDLRDRVWERANEIGKAIAQGSGSAG